MSLIIRNGTVIDPETGREERLDLAVEGKEIVRMEPEISESAVSEIDAEGCMVTPGLIDHHAHVYPWAKIGIPGEAACFSAGVMTVVDAGSTGCETFEQYLPALEHTKLEVFFYLNVCSTGLSSLPEAMEDVAPTHMDRQGIRETLERYRGRILGLKLRTSKNIVGDLGLGPLKEAVCIGEELKAPLMVHITNPPEPVEEILRCLRPGDIVTHMYQNTGYSILENGQVSREVKEAREKGILFEAADARAHFSFEVGEAAMKEKFYPDFIGTDLTKLSMHLRPTSFNMAMQVSKYVFLGLPFLETIKRCTWNPAVSMGISGRVGSLKPGKQADIAVFRPCRRKNVFGDRPYSDKTCSLRTGDLVYEPVLTVKNGEMVFRNVTF